MQEPPIEQITRRIVEAFNPVRIVLFGSRARGTARAAICQQIDLSPYHGRLARADDVGVGNRRLSQFYTIRTGGTPMIQKGASGAEPDVASESSGVV